MRRWLIPIIAVAFLLFSVAILSQSTNEIAETKQHGDLHRPMPGAFFESRHDFRNNHVSAKAIVVLITTFYPSTTDVRYTICLNTLKVAKIAGLEVVVVDASPDESVRDQMRLAGAHVFQQTAKDGKGGALRQALREGMKLPGVTLNTFMCFQEPEKTALVHEWAAMVAAAKRASASVVMPARDPHLFKTSYPVEQWHSESFAHSLITAMAIDAGVLEPNQHEPAFDWFFGPVGFENNQSPLWLENQGTMWDAQLIPVAHACGNGVHALSVTVPYVASPRMKQQEEGNIKFIEKRLMQMNFLVPKFKQAFAEISNKNENQRAGHKTENEI
eukprot:m.181828 g.181828  ORF g.181828 m.181828 type:complete len:330 (-) comp32081_c1_seq4:332-1321(-)